MILPEIMLRAHRHRVFSPLSRAARIFFLWPVVILQSPSPVQATADVPGAPDLQQISKVPETWPQTVSVLAPLAVDLAINGKKLGQATVQPSQKLKLVGIEGGKLLVSVGSIATTLAPEQTNFWQCYEARQQEIKAEKPVSEQTAAPAPSPVPTQLAAEQSPPPAAPIRMGLPSGVPLTRRPAEKTKGDISVVTGRFYQPLSTSPSTLKSEPEGIVPAYFEISVAGQKHPLAVDFGDVNRVKVYFDTKGEGDLKSTKPLSAQNSISSRGTSSQYGQYEIGPLAAEQGGKAGAPFKLAITRSSSSGPSGRPQGYLRVLPADQYSGTATLAGRKVEVVLVDGDLDGKLQPGFRTEFLSPGDGGPPPFDCLAVDWNGDHQFDYRSEVLPLVPLLGIGGQHYELEPSAESLGIREVRPELGVLEKASPDIGLVLVSAGAAILLDGGDKAEWKLPAGDYSTSYFRLAAKKGAEDWVLHGNIPGPSLEHVSVLSGQTTALKIGVPLTPHFDVTWKRDGGATIGFSLRGAGGESYEAGGRMGGNRQPPPDLKIVNREGKVLERGSFEYG